MHRNTTASIIALSLGLAALPVRTYAAGASFFGPIISTTCLCDGGPPDYGCVLQTIQNVINLGISFSAILATLYAAYTGFIFMSSGGSAEAKQKGKNLALNLVVGLVVILSAWLIVDFVMKTIYNGGSQFGPWNAILADNGNHACIGKNGSPTSLTNGLGGGTFGGGGATLSVAGNGLTYQSPTTKESAAGALTSLLTCISGKLPANGGIVTAITDSYVLADASLIAHCDSVGSQGDSKCVHTAHSCHYGGSCGSASYAADIAGPSFSAIESATSACDSRAWINNEGSHVHISVGAESGCGCDTSGRNNL